MSEENRREIATELTQKIEACLESFGIKSRVEVANFGDNEILLELSIADGVRVEEVEALEKTLAMVVSSPSGTITLKAPLPGTDRIGIEVPLSSKEV